ARSAGAACGLTRYDGSAGPDPPAPRGEETALTPPPIRYPLPTLIALLLAALLAWRGASWAGAWRPASAARMARAGAGPAVPSSPDPKVVAGPILRRVLLLHDETPVADTPGGRPTDSVRHRMFADVYDLWPPSGDPTHYRIGNRRPLGWVSAADA